MTSEPDEQYRLATRALAAEIAEHLGDWIRRSVAARIPSDWDVERRTRLETDVAPIAGRVRDAVVAQIEELGTQDVEMQRTGPLEIIRHQLGPITDALSAAHVPVVPRDPFVESMFPHDRYNLYPSNFEEIDPVLHDRALVWGAAKAHVVLTRRKGGSPQG